MVDVGSVQVLTSSASGGVSPANDGPGGRSRAQVDDQQGRSANNRAVAFTAKFGNPEIDGGFRIVRGGEVQAIESADINALTEIRRSQAAAQALLSLQEVGDDGAAPAAPAARHAAQYWTSSSKNPSLGNETDYKRSGAGF